MFSHKEVMIHEKIVYLFHVVVKESLSEIFHDDGEDWSGGTVGLVVGVDLGLGVVPKS